MLELPPRDIHRLPVCPDCEEAKPEGCRDIGSSIRCLVRECECTAINGDYCEAHVKAWP